MTGPIDATADWLFFEDARSGRSGNELCDWLVRKQRARPALKSPSAVKATEQLKKGCSQTCPSRLMAGAKASPAVTVEVLVEQDEVAPMRIVLELLRSTKYWTLSTPVAKKDSGQPRRKFLRHFEQGHQATGACRTLHGEIVAVISVERQERAVQQHVDRHPDRLTPVGVAAEHAAGVRFGRKVTD